MADRLSAEWMAVHISTPGDVRQSDAARQRLHQHLRLAENLGAEIVLLSGEEIVPELIRYAGSRNVTKIVVGKTDEPHRHWFARPSLVGQLVRGSDRAGRLNRGGRDGRLIA